DLPRLDSRPARRVACARGHRGRVNRANRMTPEPWSHTKSTTTLCFDVVRHVLIAATTGYVVVRTWNWQWVVALVVALPLYVALLNLIGFLTLPLYMITPENRLKARIHTAMSNGDLDRARALSSEFAARFNVNAPLNVDDDAARS